MVVTSSSGGLRCDTALRSRLWSVKHPADLSYPETYATPRVSPTGELKAFREVARLVRHVWQQALRDESSSWLKEAMEDLEEIGHHLDLGSSGHNENALVEARNLLESLAQNVLVDPIVSEFDDSGITIEFEGEGQTRLTILIRPDKSANYYELLDGKRWRGKFRNATDMMSVIWPGRFLRAKIAVRL